MSCALTKNLLDTCDKYSTEGMFQNFIDLFSGGFININLMYENINKFN